MKHLTALCLVVGALFWSTPAYAQAGSRPAYAGRPLADVLRDLQGRDLKIVFSTELVRPDMKVATEPRSTTPRKILDEVLKPHQLEIRSGAGGSLLVVRSPGKKRSTTQLAGGTGTITGTVIDAASGIALPNAIVAARDANVSTVTDANGAFTLTGLRLEPHTLFVSLVGFGLARPTVDVPANGAATITIPLASGTGTYTEAVTVQADRFRQTTVAAPSEQALTSADITALRGVLTDDPLRAVQALPGVATGNDFRSDFAVRGSDPRHIGLQIDGVASGWPVHVVRGQESAGSIAIINGDIIDGVTLAAGAFPQDRPGRTGAWLDFSIRPGSRDATELHGSVSMTNAAFIAEGPIGSSRRGSWLTSIRQSYLQWIVSRIGSGGTALGFTDAMTKVVFDVTPRQQILATVIAGRSRLDKEADFVEQNHLSAGESHAGLATVGWRSLFGSSVVLTQRAALTWSGFRNRGVLDLGLGNGTTAEGAYRADAIWTVRPAFTFDTGVYVQHQRQTENLVRYIDTPAGFDTGRREEIVRGTAWTTSGYVRAIWGSTTGTNLDGGAWVSYSALTGETIASPWILGAVPVSERFTLRAGASLNQQHPTIDAVLGSFGRPDVGREFARSIDVGVEHRLSPAVRWQVTVYDRQERDVLRLQDSEQRLDGDDQLVYASLQPFWQNALTGQGRGVEFTVQRRAPTGLSGWIGYSFGRLQYTDEQRNETFDADFDQRHTLNAYAEYRLSPRTSVSVKLRIGSNFPLPGYYQMQPAGLFLNSERNTERVPVYARFDVRANRTFNFDRRRLTLFAEVLNVLNRSNYIAAVGSVRSNGQLFGWLDKLFPILPSVGLRFDF